MKKWILLAVIFCLPAAIPAQADDYNWAIELRVPAGVLYTISDNWEELFDGRSLPLYGVDLNMELFHGLGPYIGFSTGSAENKVEDAIDVKWSTIDGHLGLQYRYFIRPWVAPEIRLGGLYLSAEEKISDDTFEYKMESSTFGYEILAGMMFYPLAIADVGADGLGIGIQVGYQERPLEEMGDLDKASGYFFFGSLQYRFDIGMKKSSSGDRSGMKKNDDGDKNRDKDKR